MSGVSRRPRLLPAVCLRPRCVPCQRLEPIFADAARQLAREAPPIRLGRVQIPDQMKVAERFPLQGYPLLIIFRHGAHYNYTGPKDSAAGRKMMSLPWLPLVIITGIVEYMRQQAGPSSVPLEQTGDVRKFINKKGLSVVAYFREDTGIPPFTRPDPVMIASLSPSRPQSSARVSGVWEPGPDRDGTWPHPPGGRGQGDGAGGGDHCGLPPSVCGHHGGGGGGGGSGRLSLSLSSHLVSDKEKGHSVITSPPPNASQLRELYLEHALPLVGQMIQGNHDNLYNHRPLLVAYYDVDWSSDGFKGQQSHTSCVFNWVL